MMKKIVKNTVTATILIITLVHCGPDDACKGDKVTNCVCDASYVPVCGCDDVTYSNACVAKCEGIQDFKAGACLTVQSTSIVGDWDFIGFNAGDNIDLSNPVKTHPYDVNINFDDEAIGNNQFKVDGKSSINVYSSTYSISGNKIEIGPIESTEIAGSPEANTFENLYYKWLSGDMTYVIINKNILQITSTINNRTEILIFKKK